jgi:nucleoside-diphosphate-sugar epimerase
MSPAPKSPYAISKLAAEMYCRVFNESFGLETVILRYFNVYGPRQDPSSAYSGVISIFVDKLRQGQIPTIFGNGKQTRDFVYVEDVVQANLLAGAVPAASGQIFNIGCGQQVSINYLFEQVRSLLRINVVANYAPARNGDIAHSYADPTLAAQILGWQPQTLLEKGLYQLLTADQKIRKN